MLSLLALALHEVGAEGAIGRILVMGGAEETGILDGRLSAARDGVDVVVLEEAPRLAAVSGLPHEGASATVPLPDRALHAGGDVSRAGGAPAPGGARLRGRREPALLELHDQRIETAFEHLGDVSGEHPMAEKLPGVPELLLGASAERDLMQKAVRGNGFSFRPRNRSNLPRGKFTRGRLDRPGPRWRNSPRGEFISIPGR